MKLSPVADTAPQFSSLFLQAGTCHGKLTVLEKNMGSLLDSEMDEEHKRFVLAVLRDYRDALIKRMNKDAGLH